MSPWEAVGACLAVAIGLYLVASWALDLRIRRSNRRRWQQSTAEAALAPRTEDEVRRNVSAFKARQDETQAQFDDQFAQIVAGYRNTIPQQTRRTEEDQ